MTAVTPVLCGKMEDVIDVIERESVADDIEAGGSRNRANCFTEAAQTRRKMSSDETRAARDQNGLNPLPSIADGAVAHSPIVCASRGQSSIAFW